MSTSLLSTTSRVQSPFVLIEIAGYQFGVYDKKTTNSIGPTGPYKEILTRYPNFFQSLDIKKVNGTVNTYTLSLAYVVTATSDPNFLERVFSAASKTRTITLSYGDFANPTFIYKEEKALITKVTSSMNVASSVITYTITCVSQSVSLKAGTRSYPFRRAKPSDVIKELVRDKRDGITEVYSGMKDISDDTLSKLIDGSDKVVDIEAKPQITVFDYLNYLVSCMVYETNSNLNGFIANSRYMMCSYDDVTGQLGGTYFKVMRIDNNTPSTTSLDTYELTVGFPDADLVMNFTMSDDETYAILYDYAGTMQQEQYSYRINDDGEIETIFSPQIATNNELYKATVNEKVWWSNMTQYPIRGQVKLRGLIKPAILMTYVRLNVYFFGRKHISSGLYVVTGEQDQISESGFTTTLSLMRVGGDTQ